nr:MAG: hypothetical protein [uncultured archaeon]
MSEQEDKEHIERLKNKELICYAIGAIGKDLYDKINKVGEKLILKGTNTLPFKAELDIRNAGKRFVVDIAIQCLDYLLDKGE